MRLLVLTLLLALPAGPALAWIAGQDSGVCTLTHAENGAEVRLTHDPTGPRYSITVTAPTPWPEAAVFSIAFLGGAENTISTSSHVLSDDGLSLTVIDRGFGNVLDGLSRNNVAAMFTGDMTVPFSLEGAAPEVAIFAACSVAALS
jgi:hypothetical protein